MYHFPADHVFRSTTEAGNLREWRHQQHAHNAQLLQSQRRTRRMECNASSVADGPWHRRWAAEARRHGAELCFAFMPISGSTQHRSCERSQLGASVWQEESPRHQSLSPRRRLLHGSRALRLPVPQDLSSGRQIPARPPGNVETSSMPLEAMVAAVSATAAAASEAAVRAYESAGTEVYSVIGASPFDYSEPCPICLEPILRGQDAQTLPCFHRFHAACSGRAFRSALSVLPLCPVCRHDIRKSGNGEDIIA